MATGYYIRDNIQLADALINSAIIAMTNETSDSSYGVLGIGLNGLESTPIEYSGFLDELRTQGIIKTRAYSLYLDNLGKFFCQDL